MKRWGESAWEFYYLFLPRLGSHFSLNVLLVYSKLLLERHSGYIRINGALTIHSRVSIMCVCRKWTKLELILLQNVLLLLYLKGQKYTQHSIVDHTKGINMDILLTIKILLESINIVITCV